MPHAPRRRALASVALLTLLATCVTGCAVPTWSPEQETRLLDLERRATDGSLTAAEVKAEVADIRGMSKGELGGLLALAGHRTLLHGAGWAARAFLPPGAGNLVAGLIALLLGGSATGKKQQPSLPKAD